PMTDVALSAGFASVRRFNDELRRAFGEAPTALRRRRRTEASPNICLRLAYKPPYDWPNLIGFLRPPAIPGVEIVNDGIYRRTVSIDGDTGILEVEPAPGEACVVLRVSLSLSRALLPIVERVQRLFDLRADPLVIDEHLGNCPLLAARVA